MTERVFRKNCLNDKVCPENQGGSKWPVLLNPVSYKFQTPILPLY